MDNNKDKQTTDDAGADAQVTLDKEQAPAAPSDSTTASTNKKAASKKTRPDVQAGKPDKENTPGRRSSLAIWLLVILVLLSLAVSAAVVWYGLQQRQQLGQLQQQLQGMAQQTQADRQTLNTLGQRQQQQDSGDRALQDQLATVSRQAQHNEQRLAGLAGSDRQDWLLAEVEYLLRLANQRLNLERDVTGAAAMLVAADKVLLEINNPAYDNVRTKIASEIQQLRRVPGVDKVGAIARLQAMQDSLDQVDWLPQVRLPSTASDANTTLAGAAQAWYQQLFDELKQGLAQVVRIRRQDSPVDIPMAPEQAYYLQQNAHLMLEQAQLAMLRGDQNLYDNSLGRVKGWVERYLPKQDQAVLALRQLLGELQQWQVSPAVPDISASLQALRARMILDETEYSPEQQPVAPAAKATTEPQGAQP
ncbi:MULTISPECIES: uroporphyrinogen-III C-methyltransferase [unclassified Oceanobacter]|uniref:uroporphyrinogen-III C-methyltransferase n=1 Tax=unclassified Oceanobacter TaxID=2620260 RepID=UPI002732DC60|nr:MULTISPECIES: uroporphyrinogen-III C-methyltransferase [unclassified Oceanobacter]MDP2607785.1 uroporphyrinogen-III C-methyltransferase [Oceanobacter sp. 1_MG-2023]MDP2611031.1 uroporphyrinogen-III C-methyltransferase [Oceanobacter sp. 2_MG-2023]